MIENLCPVKFNLLLKPFTIFVPQISGDITDILCKFKVYNVTVWYAYLLWNVYHNKVSEYIYHLT